MDAERSSGHLDGYIRIDRLRQIAHSLELAHAAVLGSDLREITRQTARQRELCAEIQQLPVNPLPATGPWLPEGLTPWLRDGNDALGKELAATAKKVAQLNRRYEALLRRARRTVDIFCRVLAHSALTYPPPRSDAASFAAGLQK